METVDEVLAVIGVEPMVIGKGRWSPERFMVYARGNMEDSLWLSTLLLWVSHQRYRLPMQGTMWG